MRIILFIALCFPTLLWAELPEKQALNGNAPAPVLRIFADSSLVDIVSALTQNYSPQQGISISTTFGSPQELMQRIEDGEAADVVIANNAAFLEQIKQKGLVDSASVRQIGTGRLVLAISKKSLLLPHIPKTQSLPELLAWLLPRTFIINADPETDALGFYTNQVFTALGISPSSARQIKASNSQEAIYVAEENNAAGLFYAHTLHPYSQLRIIAEVPPALHAPIVYYAGAIASENMPQARQFLSFLVRKAGADVLQKHGL